MGILDILVLLTVFVGFAHAQGKTGISGQDIVLSCDLEISQTTTVKWTDWVYNEDRNPMDIWTSTRGTISADHPNGGDMMVDTDTFSLTIKNLDIDDYGEYVCTTVSEDGSETEYVQKVNVVDPPMCTEDLDVLEGESAIAVCSTKFAGQFPALVWYRDDQEVDTDQQSSDVSDTETTLRLDADWSMDNSEYICHMGDMDETCSVRMAVKYKVRDVSLTPSDGELIVGSKVMCSAKGNPEPTIELEAAGATLPQISEKSGKRFFIVPISWQGEQVAVTCNAKNDLGNSTTIVMEYEIMEPTTTAEPTKAVIPTEAQVATSSTNMAGIVAAVVICALVIIVIIIAVIILRKRNRNRPHGAKPVPTKEEEIRERNGGGKGGVNNGSSTSNGGGGHLDTYSNINKQPENTTHYNSPPPNGNATPLLGPDQDIELGDFKASTVKEDANNITYADLDFEQNQGSNTSSLKSPSNDLNNPPRPWQRHPSNEVVYSDVQK